MVIFLTKYQVIFQPSGRRDYVEEGKSLLDAAKEIGAPLEAPCGGERQCSKCKVIVSKGMDNLSQIAVEERLLLSNEEIVSNYRLACCSIIKGNVVVAIPEVSRAKTQVIRKPIKEIPIKLDPAIKKYYLEIKPPTLHHPLADLENLISSLKEQGCRNLNVDYDVIKKLPFILRQGEWKVTATVWDSKEVVRLEPGNVKESYGLAVDIGTTTVVGYLIDLSSGKVVAADSIMNPQVSYGEDVITRINYTLINKDGLERLNQKIVDGLNLILLNTVREAGINFEDVYEVVLVGNTCMHHLFLNIPPEYLGKSPFPPAVQRSVNIKSRDTCLTMLKSGNVHFLPVVAGFVGADNVGVLIATEPWKKTEVQLIVDIGTNGELVLGNSKKMLSCSCATGPAFEGAQIKCGMRAAVGAIERVKIDQTTLDAKFKTVGDAKATGICGSGIIEAVAEMFKAGIILKNGSFNKNLNSQQVRKGQDGYEYILAPREDTAINDDIVVTQKDVRAFQLAKGALYAGAKILMRRFGVKKLDTVILAGAFGSYVDPEAALTVGLFPYCSLERVVAVGNAAGDGARLALISKDKRREAEKVARQVKYIELTTDPAFEEEFMKAMHFPHKEDEFPHLNRPN